VDSGDLRPVEGLVREAPRPLLAQRGSARRGRPVLRPRKPVPLRHLLHRRGAAPRGRGLEGRAREGSPLRGQDRHPDPPGLAVLSSRGASPGILQEGTRALRALSKGLRARREAQGALGRGRGRTLVKRTAIVTTLAAVGLAFGLSAAASRAQDSKTEN